MVRERQVAPAELMDAAIAGAEKHNTKLNAIVFKDYDRARRGARAQGRRRAVRGGALLLKDIIGDCAGMPTRSACAFIPAMAMLADSELVARFGSAVARREPGWRPRARCRSSRSRAPPQDQRSGFRRCGHRGTAVLTLSHRPASDSAGPRIGEHTKEVLAAVLGMSPAEIVQLDNSGVLV